MKKWKVILSSPAESDLEAIYAYIAEKLLEPGIAKKQTARILEEIFTLDEMPERYALFENKDLCSRGYRRLIIGKYIVIYRIVQDKGIVLIVTITNGRRNIEGLLRQEEFHGGETVWPS